MIWNMNLEITDELNAKVQDCVKTLVAADTQNKINQIVIEGLVKNGNAYALLDGPVYLTVYVNSAEDMHDEKLSDVAIDYRMDRNSDVHFVIEILPVSEINNGPVGCTVWDSKTERK